MQLDSNFPLTQLNERAQLESYNKHYYRPANYLPKWWDRGLETSFIAGLVMAKMPTREEFDQLEADKMAARLSTSQDGGE